MRAVLTTLSLFTPAPPRALPIVAKADDLKSGSIRTWTYRCCESGHVRVVLENDAQHSLDADMELWRGPDETPLKMRVYAESGHPFETVISTLNHTDTLAIRNTGQTSFLTDVVQTKYPIARNPKRKHVIQGGALRTYELDQNVKRADVFINTDGRPLNARLEVLDGPNDNVQVVEVYSKNACNRPFFCSLTVPESGKVIRVVNTAPTEHKMVATITTSSISPTTIA